MKKALFFVVLSVFGLVSKAQIHSANINYVCQSIASDTGLVLIAEKTHITIWDMTLNKSIDVIRTYSPIQAAGFVSSTKIGVISKKNGFNHLSIVQIGGNHEITNVKFNIVGSHYDYKFYYDQEKYYITSPSQAITWSFKKSNNSFVGKEFNVVLSDNCGTIIKHLYKFNSSDSYGIVNSKTNSSYLKSDFSNVRSFNTEGFNITNDKLIIADAEQTTTIRVYDVKNQTKKILEFKGKHTVTKFVSFLDNDNVLLIECLVKMTDMSMVNYLTIKDLNGQEVKSISLKEGHIREISISSDRKYLIYRVWDVTYSIEL